MHHSSKSRSDGENDSDSTESTQHVNPLFEDTSRYFKNGFNGNAKAEPTPSESGPPPGPFAIDDDAPPEATATSEVSDQLAAMFGTPKNNTREEAREDVHSHHGTASPSAVPSVEAQQGAPTTRASSNGRSTLWTIAALVVGGFAVWFLVGELTTASSLQGATVGNLIHLRAGVPGTVSDIAIGEATQVEAGQVIARLDSEGIEAQLARTEDVLNLKRLEAAQVSSSIVEEKQRLELLHEISQRTETHLDLEIQEQEIQLELATKLASELKGSVRRGSAKEFEFLEAESRRLRVATQLKEKEGELDLQKLITSHAAEGRHYHAGVVRTWLDELQLHAAKVATEIGQTEVEAATLRTLVDQGTIATHRAGRVFAVHHHPGSSVQAGDPLVTLETDDRVWIIASFKYTEAEHIAYGDRAEIEFPALDRSIFGTVVAIGHSVISATDAASPFLRLTPEEVLVKIEPDSSIDELHSGISAQVKVHTSGFDPLGWVSSRFRRSKPDQEAPAVPTSLASDQAPVEENESESPSDSASTGPPAPPSFPEAEKAATSKTPPTTEQPRPTAEPLPPMNNPFDFSQQ